jgi:hypothetical protein
LEENGDIKPGEYALESRKLEMLGNFLKTTQKTINFVIKSISLIENKEFLLT